MLTVYYTIKIVRFKVNSEKISLRSYNGESVMSLIRQAFGLEKGHRLFQQSCEPCYSY
jgi:hypothetical protein